MLVSAFGGAALPVAVSAQASPSPAPATASPAASPSPAAIDPAVVARAKAEFLAWQSGKIDRSHYSAAVNTGIPDATVWQIASQLRTFGDFVSLAPQNKSAAVQGGVTLTVYDFLVTCKGGNIAYRLVINPSDKIDGIFFRPA